MKKRKKKTKFYLVGDRHYTSLSQILYYVRKIKNNNKDKRLSKNELFDIFKLIYML